MFNPRAHDTARPHRGRLYAAGGAALVAGALGLGLLLLNDAMVRATPDGLERNEPLLRAAAAEGWPVYATRCAGCHGLDLQGRQAVGAPDLRDRSWLYGTGRIAEIERTIVYGVRSGHPRSRNLASMPAYATATPYDRERLSPLTPDQIRDVVAYLRRLQQRPVDPLAARRGEAIYQGAGGCYDCHTPDARGDAYIGAPGLTARSGWLYGDGSPEALFASIARGRAGVCPAWIDRLSFANIRALAALLFVRSRPSSTAERRR